MKKLALKLLISSILIGLIIWKIDFSQVASNVRMVDFKIAPLVILFIILNYIISSVRWKALLIHSGDEKVSVGYLTKLYFIGAFFNNFMPTSIGGDAYKVYKLGGRIGNTSDAFTATFMERFTGVAALTLISLVSLMSILGYNGVLLFLAFWAFVLVIFLILKKVILVKTDNAILAKVIGILARIYDSFMKYKGNFKILAWALFTSFLVQLMAVGSQYFVFRSIGVNLPIIYSLFAFPFIFLAGYAIPSLNGLGVQDALYIQMFGAAGISAGTALSASILYHFFRLAVSLIGGVLYAAGKAD